MRSKVRQEGQQERMDGVEDERTQGREERIMKVNE